MPVSAQELYTRNADGTMTRQSADPPKTKDDGRDWSTYEDPTEALWAVIKGLTNRQTWRRMADELALQLYSDMRYVGYRTTSSAYQVGDILEARVGDNVIRAVVRVLNSKCARRRSRPYVVTNGASWAQRQTAENLERWLLGKLRGERADEEKFPKWRLHAFVFGTGCIRVFSTPEGGPQIEVIPPNEVIVDDAEAKYGDPQNIYIVRTMTRNRLRHDYPDKLELIEKSAQSDGREDAWVKSVGAWDRDAKSDILTVVEAYHLPSGPGADDGVHVICCHGGLLYKEPWKRDHFPMAWMRGELRPEGFWGIGVPEDLASTQIEISRIALARQELIDMLGAPYWLVEKGMKVARAAISNVFGRIMEFTSTGSGNAPQLVVPPVVPPDFWQHGEALKKTAFETKGVSQLSAQMLKPSGLNSGRALRAYHEFESELMSDLLNEYENGLLRVCELLIEEQIELAEEYEEAVKKDPDTQVPDWRVTYVGQGEIESIKWSDVGLKKDLTGYVIEILPASALASTLSARIEDVFDLRDLGAIADPDEIWDYLDIPDRRRLRRKKLSPRHLLEKVVEQRIVRKGEDVMPEPSWDLEYAKETALTAISELELYEDAPEDRLELLRIFVKRCIDIQAQMAAATAPPPGMEMMNGIGSDALGGSGLGPDASATGGAAGSAGAGAGWSDLGAGSAGAGGPAGGLAAGAGPGGTGA